jgi:hypothetical protein
VAIARPSPLPAPVMNARFAGKRRDSIVMARVSLIA